MIAKYRRCSICRQTGHDARNCEERVEGVTIRRNRATCRTCNQQDHAERFCAHKVGGVVVHGQVVLIYGDNRRNLIHAIVRHIVNRVPSLLNMSAFQDLFSERVENYVFNMTHREFNEAVRSPGRHITICFNIAFEVVDDIVASAAASANMIYLGKDHAKNIDLDLCCAEKEPQECEICFDNKCGVKTGCGHDFCTRCVVSIIDANKHKTSKPVCSFCRAPFAKFTMSDTLDFTEIQEFIENL